MVTGLFQFHRAFNYTFSLSRKLRTNMYTYLIHILLTFYNLHRHLVVAHGGECREERSQRGFALLNTSYSSISTQRYSDCVNLCFYDPRCMSFNFWWDKRKCDLNTKAREHSCGSCFATEASSTYMGMARFPGYPGK